MIKMNYQAEKIVIEQGYFMSPVSKSEIIIKLTKENGALVKIMAGGTAIMKKEIEITLD